MNKDERRKKLEESSSQARKKAVALEAALQKKKEREEFSKMVEEERARQKERKFVIATTTEEAEGDIPSIAELIKQPEESFNSTQRILEEGSIYEKIFLYISDIDLNSYLGSEPSLTQRDKAKIAASIKTEEDKELLTKSIKEYNILRNYGMNLSYYFKRFQTAFAVLAVLLNKWDSYDKEAQKLTTSLKRWRERDKEVSEWFVKISLLSSVEDQWEGARLRFDHKKDNFSVDVDGDGGLYSKIREEAASTTEALSDFKAYAVVVQEFLEKESKLQYMPISIQMSIENAEEERYTRYLVKNLSFFRSEINLRKSKGEKITKEEEKMAVIPDYYEVTPTKEVYKDCKEGLRSYFK